MTLGSGVGTTFVTLTDGGGGTTVGLSIGVGCCILDAGGTTFAMLGNGIGESVAAGEAVTVVGDVTALSTGVAAVRFASLLTCGDSGIELTAGSGLLKLIGVTGTATGGALTALGAS